MKLVHRFLSFVLALSMVAFILPVSHQYAHAADTQVVDVIMYIGQIYTLTNFSGAYDTYTSTGNNVSVELSPSTTYLLGDSVTSLEDNQKYYIKNTRSNDMLTGVAHTSGGLVTSGSTENLPANALWQISNNSSTNNTMYALFQETGKNLVLTDGGCNLTGQSTNLYLEYQSGGYWHIRDGTYGLNDYGNNQGRAAGYRELDTGSQWIFYNAISQSTTEITFTAFSPGSTVIITGNTTYNVTVLAHPDVPTLDSTPFVNRANSDQQITKLTITAGFSLVDLDIAAGFLGSDSVSWTTEDSTIATVDADGAITGVNAGNTNIIATINGQTISIPVSVLPYEGDTGSEYRTYNAYIDKLHNCEAYYSLDCSETLVAVSEGELIYIQTPKDQYSSIDFFGRPKDGYALNEMGATNALGHYSAINSDTAADTDLYGNEGIVNQRGLFGDTVVLNMISSTIDLKCQGGLAFTRRASEGDMSTSLTFIAERLPTMTKDVVGILGEGGKASDYRAYVPGMTAKVGEIVWFRIMVTNYVTEGDPLIFSDASISDKLAGATLVKVNYNAATDRWENVDDTDQVTYEGDIITKVITDDLNKSITKDTVYRYIFAYEITKEDLEKTIINTAQMSFSYQSKYNSSSFTLDATASAQITATQFPPQHIVLDYGLPTTVYFEDWGAGQTLVSGTADCGNVSIETVYKEDDLSSPKGWYVSYTPTQVLQKVDTVFLESNNGTLYSLYVYPATTVYYEEDFASFNGFSGGSKGIGSQQGSFVGDQNHYGFDPKYANEGFGSSNGTQAVSSAFGDTAEFVFTGTGVEIYANCDPNTDRMVVMITNSSGKLVRFYQVDTKTGGGSPITGSQEGITAYSLPVVSVLGLERDTYTVQINHTRRNSGDAAGKLQIDGFRVHGTLDTGSAPYVSDGEADPHFLQLRDNVLHIANVPSKPADPNGSIYADGQNIVDQVFQQIGTTVSTVYLTNENWSDENLQDLIDNGPKNELYLYNQNDTLTFTLDSTVTAAQIGLKAVNGAASCTITVGGNSQTIALNTCTDMFYVLDLTKGTNITITNAGDSIVSITQLKYFTNGEDATPALASLTAEDMTFSLRAMGYEEPQAPVEPVKPVNPFVDVGENSRFKEAILWAYAEGITSGKSETTFEPNSEVTRAQFVTFLWRAAGKPEPASDENPFEDVGENSRFRDAILWAYHAGITSGKTATTFCPSDTCTRGQVVMFLYRYAGSPDISGMENPFEDVSEGNRFYEAILWAYQEGITSGKTATTFDVTSPCTRAQVVTFLYRLLG